jgi:hypothetical protein
VEKDERGRVQNVSCAGLLGDAWMQVGSRRDLRRFADRLEQKLANLAGVRIGNAAAGRYGSFLRIFVLVMMAAPTVPMFVLCDASDNMVHMVMVVRDERVQTLANQRDAGVGCQ